MKNFEFEHEGKKYWYSRACAVLAIVEYIDKDGNKFVLANKRGQKTPDYKGMWNMPCGYIDFNESAEEAAIREVFEETGLRIRKEDLELVHVNSCSKDSNNQNITIRYKVTLSSDSDITLSIDNCEPCEVEKAQWISTEHINRYEWAFNHEKLIEKYVINDINKRDGVVIVYLYDKNDYESHIYEDSYDNDIFYGYEEEIIGGIIKENKYIGKKICLTYRIVTIKDESFEETSYTDDIKIDNLYIIGNISESEKREREYLTKYMKDK